MSLSVRRPQPVAVRAPSRLRAGRNPVASQRQHTKSPSHAPPTPAGDATALYEAGRQYARLARASGVGSRKGQTVQAVARSLDVPHEQFRRATRFTAAVDRIAANSGAGTKRLLLSGHPCLSAKVIMRIARTHADRQRFALDQARAGRNPLGPPPPGVEPPFDTLGPGEVLNRLGG